MDTLEFSSCFPPANDFQGNCRLVAAFPDENHFKVKPEVAAVNHSSTFQKSIPADVKQDSTDGSHDTDHSDAILKFISQMLMEEEDLENMPCMLQDCLALQATERSLYDVLLNNDNYADSTTTCDCAAGESYSGKYSSSSSVSSTSEVESRGKKNHFREETDSFEIDRCSKHVESCDFESEPIEMYDNVLLCGRSDGDSCEKSKKVWRGHNRGRPKGSKKHGITREVVDLTGLLIQCAQAVANHDLRTANELLIRIRQHSSSHGDSTERLAHYFATALEARLAGTGMELYAALLTRRISAAEILKAYKTLINACPFRKMSNMLANRTINKLAVGASSLHIVDFGILYGFQWPCLIRALSERPGGPPKLHVTGIDLPQPGFRPADRVAETGRRLAKYCTRFGVPFEYTSIAQKWETIKVEDIKIEEGEVLVVNSLYRLQNVSDETVITTSPRDAVLRLIRKINPDMFIFGVVNGTYNIPYFVTRFREALFQYSSLFDMFDATMDREDENRLLLEGQLYGKEALNIIACEGSERVEQPETYKQWKVRNKRAGFRQVPLDAEIVKCVKNKVKMEYHVDFSVDEDGKWMLQGWKGRVLHALSCWQPANKSS